MIVALVLLIAIGAFLLDAFRNDIFPKVDKQSLGLAFVAFALLLISGSIRALS